jgi:peptide/nickel transport system substrate-binding protein
MDAEDVGNMWDARFRSGRLSRRSLLRLAGAIGGASALTGVLAACGGSSNKSTTASTAGTSASTSASGSTGSPAAGGATPAASGGTSTQAPAGKPGGKLTYGIWQNPDTLDPGVSGLIATSKIDINVFDTLVYALQETDQPYYPGLASKWDVSADAMTFTFTLQTGVKFHDDTPFNAAAVKTTFEHIIDPASKSLSALGSLNPGDSYGGTEAVDDSTVKVTFKSANGGFLNAVSGISLAPVSPASLQKYGADVGSHPVGTGPFMFKEWVKQDHVTIVKNPDYNWAPSPFQRNGAAYLDEIVFQIIPEASTRGVTLENGEVDMTEELTPDDFNRLTGSGGKFQGLKIKTTGMPYDMMINVTKAPTDELAVRQAMEWATDKKSIVDTLFTGVYEPAFAPVDPTTLGFDKSLESIYTFDPDKAKQLLDQAGWKAGSDGMRSKDGKALEILFINLSGFGFDGISQLMQAQFKNVGIKMNITEQSFPAVQDSLHRGDHNMAPFFFYAVDPSFANSIYSTEAISTFNWMHYSNADVDKLINEGQQESDPAKRAPIYIELNKKIMNDAVMIPIYYKAVVLAAKKSVTGFHYTVNGFPFFYNVTAK